MVQRTILRDFRHAARIFTDANYRLSPKYGFMFYVEFDLNPLITNVSNRTAQELGMIVKSVSLPKYTIDTKIHNAYNRKNMVQNKINYDQVSITFHDDQSDTVRDFWYDYYSFYYRDSDYADATYQGIHKYQGRPSFDWGYSPRPTVGYNNSNMNQPYQYIQSIRLYSLYQKNFSEYTLVNPIITSFKHGDHNVSEGGALLEHQMNVQFETVKYLTGYVTRDTVGGFVDLHYDNVSSPLSNPAANELVLNGQGGLEKATNQKIDLSIRGARFGFSSPLFVGAPGAAGFAAGTGTATGLTASNAGANGGYFIPSLGSLTTGISSGQVAAQQLSAAGASLAGSAASTVVGGVVNGVAQGLGPNGTALISMAAQAIANPSAALQTVQNMAINFAMGAATAIVSNYANQFGGFLSNQIALGIGQLGIGTGINNLINSVGTAFSSAVNFLSGAATLGGD
jgi:hypothetical protein